MKPIDNVNLSELELKVAKIMPNRASNLVLLRTKHKMTTKDAELFIDNIVNQIGEKEMFEIRQMKRTLAINQAKIAASIKGTNELLIMSEV
jgi:hypothetical protein